MEHLHNGYIKIQPLVRDSFIPREYQTFQEIGTVLAKDRTIKDIKIGDKVIFDRFLAFKIPLEGNDEEFEWYVKFSEIISSKNAKQPIPKKQV